LPATTHGWSPEPDAHLLPEDRTTDRILMQHREILLKSEPASVRRAREFAHATLSDAGCTDDGAIDIVISELVTNAIVHGGPPITLHLWPHPGHVRVGVSDSSPATPERRDAAVSSHSGRGLMIVERLAMHWGSDPRHDGKLAWADVACT